MTDIAVRDTASILESVVVGGDLSKLTSGQRVDYYQRVCTSLNLNPLTKPFLYLSLQGRLTLYASRDATDQLRKLHSVKVRITSRERADDLCVVTALAELPDGRTDESIGAVNIAGLKGDALANALMKAETKAKRRVTLSICGLGMLDETEIDTIPDTRVVNQDTGEIAAPAPKVALGTTAKAKTVPMAGFICENCERPIEPAQIAGAMRTPEYIATATKRRFKMQLCADCGRKAQADLDERARKAAAEAALPPMADDDEAADLTLAEAQS